MLVKKLKEMFTKMVEGKKADLIPLFYHEDFLLFTNGLGINYEEFLRSHKEYYQTEIQYSVTYDEETLFESEDRLAGRVWITTQLPGQKPKKIEVILIVTYREGKIFRLWELTYPDWSKLPEFTSI